MIIIDEPYVSGFLLKTITENRIPVLNNAFAQKHLSGYELLLSDAEAVERMANQNELLYTSSENAIGWIDQHLKDTGLPEKIGLFKDKARFRELIASLFPDFYYRKVRFKNLPNIDPGTLPFPFVLKPNVGFFSLGVHRINTVADWQKALTDLKEEVKSMNDIYPEQVMNASEFIIESYIDGDEYAVDCYFDAGGTPVITNIMKHLFASESDVSDRLYYTSKQVIGDLKDPMLAFLTEMNRKAGLKNFPLHIEIRVSDGKIIPIEGNPMRLGGWCTTGDMTYHAYGFNPYLYFLEQKTPDWDAILDKMDDSYYSLVLLTNSTGFKAEEIKDFDYQKLLNDLEDPLELRKIDYHQFPVFGFVFIRTSVNNRKEMEHLLTSDLSEYVILDGK